MAERLDSKGRKLRTGEYYDEKTGRYKYRYKDVNGKLQTIYRDVYTDKMVRCKNEHTVWIHYTA